jgi:glutamyl-tRNA synthetase
MTKHQNIRVRIAPSPTGLFHIGTARTALFNYIFAKQKRGQFILRIEDTDAVRSKKEYEQDILQGLNWLGIEPDEGPEKGGAYSPYRQSDRNDLYKKYLTKLLEEGKAFYCFKKRSCKEQEVFWSPDRNMSLEEAQKKIDKGSDYVIRFKTPHNKEIIFNDLVRGEVKFNSEVIGDFALARSIDEPLYNFAAVIDDQEMKISHVIRGEDHISNTPKQILLQQNLKFNSPIFGHLPLILGKDKTKLSKRHNPISLSKYKKEGYLSEAMVNFMALLGWNPGNDKEIFDKVTLIKEFSFAKVHQAGAVFDIEKLNWLNGYYIHQLSVDRLTELVKPYLASYNIKLAYLKRIVAISQPRLKRLSDITEDIDIYLQEPVCSIEILTWKDMTREDLNKSLCASLKILQKIDKNNFKIEFLQKRLLQKAKDFDHDRGKLLWPLRVALTGKNKSPSPFEMGAVLGKEKALKRIEKAIQVINN